MPASWSRVVVDARGRFAAAARCQGCGYRWRGGDDRAQHECSTRPEVEVGCACGRYGTHTPIPEGWDERRALLGEFLAHVNVCGVSS